MESKPAIVFVESGRRQDKTSKEIADKLFELFEYMTIQNIPFNAYIHHEIGDCACLSLLNNGVGWDAVAETGKYDLWFREELKHTNLSKEKAGNLLLHYYQTDKMTKVLKRLNKKYSKEN